MYELDDVMLVQKKDHVHNIITNNITGCVEMHRNYLIQNKYY